MAKEMITIDFAPDGSTKIEAHNFTGRSCTEATSYLEKALGVTGKRKKKAEFHKANRTVKNTQSLGGGR
jgi:hypothetical protein|tara:strand:- start:375 stop:581 length:207 start_codon:yes stop_codon:yes gene_type:complete